MRLHEIERHLRRHGWALVRDHGAHRIYGNDQGHRLVIGVHPGEDVRPGNWRAITKQMQA